MSNFFQRTITGILFVSLIIGAAYYSFNSLAALCILIQVLSTAELFKMAKKTYPGIPSISGTIVNTLVFLLLVGERFFSPDTLPLAIPILMLFPFLFIPLLELYRNKKTPLAHIGIAIVPLFLISIPLYSLLLSSSIELHPSESVGHYNYLIVIGFFFIIWANDTGAYLTGISIGKNRLFERISPKKSWEGFFGGLLLANVVGVIISFYIKGLELWHWNILASTIVVAGTYGDLIESLIKRSLQIKDSGTLLPGHGGMLDRFDSVLYAATFYYIALKTIIYF